MGGRKGWEGCSCSSSAYHPAQYVCVRLNTAAHSQVYVGLMSGASSHSQWISVWLFPVGLEGTAALQRRKENQLAHKSDPSEILEGHLHLEMPISPLSVVLKHNLLLSSLLFYSWSCNIVSCVDLPCQTHLSLWPNHIGYTWFMTIHNKCDFSWLVVWTAQTESSFLNTSANVWGFREPTLPTRNNA